MNTFLFTFQMYSENVLYISVHKCNAVFTVYCMSARYACLKPGCNTRGHIERDEFEYEHNLIFHLAVLINTIDAYWTALSILHLHCGACEVWRLFDGRLSK